MHENEIATKIVDAAFKIHKIVGPGLLESGYKAILVHELTKRGLHFTRQQVVPVAYEQVRFDEGFRADVIVENKVIVELKSVETIAPIHKKQLLTYLRLTDKRLGLLINFGDVLIKNGITRVVNNLEK
ncbi:MAG: GxxExxY protein [Bacteroidota bacterium]